MLVLLITSNINILLINKVKTPVSDHPKCEGSEAPCGMGSLKRIEPQGVSSEKRTERIYIL